MLSSTIAGMPPAEARTMIRSRLEAALRTLGADGLGEGRSEGASEGGGEGGAEGESEGGSYVDSWVAMGLDSLALGELKVAVGRIAGGAFPVQQSDLLRHDGVAALTEFIYAATCASSANEPPDSSSADTKTGVGAGRRSTHPL